MNEIKLVNPQKIITDNYNKLNELKINMNNIMEKRLLNLNHNLDYLINTLKLVNPLNILSNGYSLVKLEDKVIKNSNDLKINDIIDVKFHKGCIKAKVEKVIKEGK